MKKLLNETIIYGIGAIMPRVILFILNPLYIDQIDSRDFAIFSNLYALISFVNIMLSFGFETAFFRFSSEKDQQKTTFNTSFWFLFGLSTIFLLSCLLFSQPIADTLEYSSNPEYIRWFAWIAFFDNLCVIPFAWLRYNNKPIKYSLVRVLQSLFQTVITIALFLYIPLHVSQGLGLKEKVSFPFYSNLAASFLGFILLLPVIMKVRLQFSADLFRKMIRYSWPVMIAGLAFMVNENFDKAIQIWYIPGEDAGAYGGCYKLAVLMTLFVTAYRMGIEPFFFKQMNNENAKNTYAKVTEYFTFFASTVAMGIIANISWLKQILIPNSTYWTAVDIIPIIVVANLCFGIYYNFSTWYKVTDRTRVGTVISWLGAIITISLNLVFLKKYGFMVSAWVTFIAYFVMMVTSYLLGQKYYPIPYRIKKMTLFIGLLIVFSFLIMYIFSYNFWIGNLMFLVYAGILIYSEKDMLLSRVRKRG
ncbi:MULTISPECIES: lipopolysaccharide biosynthesis protein [Chryseobacterium]|uniref:O-antigen/teichoic acid export membrane protein n=1 Tax=Chryseobacterium camelliae TaxID=1265445 RepID=A0ABU0TNU0_9FLAO|nr:MULTISPECIES: oligosaccharide flippase family protein [Chryseobacterium]MDQ1098709.1 O-antigen/teichoic acid export membrane protein [Chryseobacterium camelliae]MDQ1102636.1 O-antigen/teichoic acid export membrane protein [Chryseobacterium sp. SORGH_AS_1048]MDR6086065.1 O-antigen/teichoic acid export membrane protein [Chryseobacterium sp. SORGH_AS_0909]MDT3407440.1 O-antigen/teichoic acid export membrane protein [Pseudacidovorax intermedius]